MGRRRGVFAMLASATTVLLAACTLDAGTKASEHFTEHFTAAYPDDIVSVETAYENSMPTLGTLEGWLVLHDSTTPDRFTEILAALEAYEPRVRVVYSPLGAIANGVGVCPHDEQREAMLALRTALHEAGTGLGAPWECRRHRTHGENYRPDLQTFLSDTETVRPHLQTQGPDIDLDIHTTSPGGRVTGPWSQVSPALGTVLDAIGRDQVVTDYRLDGGRLLVAIEPTSAIEEVQARAEQTAGGELEVTVRQGSLDPAHATAYARLGPIVDQLRGVPGVTGVSASTFSVQLTVDSPASVVAVHDRARAIPELREDVHLTILIPSPTRERGSRYDVSASSEGGHVALFADLAAVDGVSSAVVREASEKHPQWIRINLDEPMETMLPRLKGHLPDGTSVELYAGRGTIELTARPTLRPEDIDIGLLSEHLDPEVLAEAWNSAG